MSTTAVRTFLINPIGKSEPMGGSPPTLSPVNYYFFLFDLPLSDSIVLSEGDFDPSSSTLEFEFTYQGSPPGESAPTKTYMRSFLHQPYTPDGIHNLEDVTVNISEVGSGGTKTLKSSGKISNPTTVELIDLPGLSEPSNSDNSNEPLPPDQIRYQVLLSGSVSTVNYYFIIILARTLSGTYINRMALEPGDTLRQIRCFYEPRPEGSEGPESDYVAAAAFLPVSSPVSENPNEPIYPVIDTILGINGGNSVTIEYSTGVITL